MDLLKKLVSRGSHKLFSEFEFSIEEELVEFHDWMVDEAHPNGLIVTDEMELIRQHPEYLNLTLGGYTEEEMDRLQLENELESAMDLDSAGAELEDLSFNHISDDNVPPMTHAPLEMNDEIESQTSRDLEGSSCLAPRASPSLSQDDDGVDDLENELLDGLDEKSAAGGRMLSCSVHFIRAYCSIIASRCIVSTESKLSRIGCDTRTTPEVSSGF